MPTPSSTNPPSDHTAAPSPTAHAIGGSLGSALALLIFYPLERARIELQSRAAAASNDSDENDQPVEAERTSPTNSDATSSSSFDMVEYVADAVRVSSQPPPSNNNVHAVASISASDSIWSCLVDLHQRGELYRGVSPVVCTLGISNYVFFYALSLIKKLLATDRDGDKGNRSKAMSLLSSSLAGVINVLLTNPLWVANLRIVQGLKQHAKIKDVREPGLFEVMGQIAREEGVAHLWSGTWASVLLVSNPVIQYFVFEQLRLLILGRRRRRYAKERQQISASSPVGFLSPVEAFAIGAISKTVATVATYPVQLAQTVLRLQEKGGAQQQQQQQARQQESPLSSANVDGGTLQCLARLYEEGGISACYAGMNAKLLQTVVTSSFMFLTYEQILALATYLA
mmetsp:Transcript_12447/g.26899  ORF Transcript_12447/g.26899 Transcript_12447/m.26899 type:complete len:399 (-) Transcript_12447:591-1787(-)